MKYRKFKQEKLWRDKAVDLLEAMGSKIHWEKLEGDQFKEELRCGASYWELWRKVLFK